MPHELPALDTYLSSLLGSDATLIAAVAAAAASLDPSKVTNNVPNYRWLHFNHPPQGTPFPYILATLQTDSDGNGVGGVRIWTKPLYFIKAVANRPSYALIRPLADRTDDLLVAQPGSVQGRIIIQRCVRQQAIRYEEQAENLIYSHLGGLYRFFLSQTPAGV